MCATERSIRYWLSRLQLAMARLYTKDELSRRYREFTSSKTDILIDMLKKTLVPFVKLGIISETEKYEWLHKKDEEDNACYCVVRRVLDKNDLDVYIKFSRGLAFLNKEQVKEVYGFIPDLLLVGLHDPLIGAGCTLDSYEDDFSEEEDCGIHAYLDDPSYELESLGKLAATVEIVGTRVVELPYSGERWLVPVEEGMDEEGFSEKNDIQLVTRQPSSKPVVLWIVKDEVMFSFCMTVTKWETLPIFRGYELRKSTFFEYFDLYVAYSKEKPHAPGRKFDTLLAKFEPCPSLLVYSGECQPGQEDSELVGNSIVLVSCVSTSMFDYTAEACHGTELCRLEGDQYLSSVNVHTRRATRYVADGHSNVHCPDAASLFSAAKRCQIPAVAIAQVQISDEERNNRDNSHYKYVYKLILKLVS